ncbi:MAG TPA: hypothetical protein VN366_03960 [Feifaniaceae bacterium]|nr:hypothetical protein [Feifaniaceae bacterium]
MVLKPAATPVPALAEPAEEEPQETPVPAEENPLGVFLNGFYRAYAPYEEALRALSEKENSATDEALALERHMLHLRQLFGAQAGLFQNPTDRGTWDGILFGVEGTGSVIKTADGCTFSCALKDGNIAGSLKGSVLAAEWALQDGAVRGGTVVKTDAGYAASVNWDGEEILLLIENDTLSFGTNAQATATVSSLPPEQWVRWRLKDGKLSVPEAEATPASIQEETE